MAKRAPLDTQQFGVTLPPPQRDPLDSLIPTAAPTIEQRSQDSYAKPKLIEARNERMNNRTDERKDERSDVQKNAKPLARPVIRHTFDIYQDQLLDLKRLQIEAMQHRRRKRKLGEMVQIALDQYIKKVKDKYSLQG